MCARSPYQEPAEADASPDLARLAGTRLALANEPEATDRFAESLIKAITGGDRIVVRELYRDPFEYAPTFKLVVLSNVLPCIRGTDAGIWRRVVLLPFDQVIPEAERRSKADLTDELMKEASLHPRYLLSVFDVDDEADVKIAVANVADNRSQQIVVSTIALGFGEAFASREIRTQRAMHDLLLPSISRRDSVGSRSASPRYPVRK